MRRWLVVLAVAALVAPSSAFAHGGLGPVVAVNYRATILSPIHGFEPRVLDGDQRLWVRARPGTRLVVLGLVGEPMLRFEGGSVYVNERSPTARVNGIARGSGGRSWDRVSVSDSYSWHEHRLHAGVVLHHSTWTIGYRLDGRAGRIAGELDYVPPPQLWLWLLPLAVGLLLATLAVRTNRAILAFPALTAVAVVVARAGRDLYGRPETTASSYASVAVAAAIAALALFGLFRARAELRILMGAVMIFPSGA